MLKCEQCGNLNPLTSQFCDECGTRLNRQTVAANETEDFPEQVSETAENREMSAKTTFGEEISTPDFISYNAEQTKVVTPLAGHSAYSPQNSAEASVSVEDDFATRDLSSLPKDFSTADEQFETVDTKDDSASAKGVDIDFLTADTAEYKPENVAPESPKPITSFEEHGNVASFDLYANRHNSVSEADPLEDLKNADSDKPETIDEQISADDSKDSFDPRQTMAFGSLMTEMPNVRSAENDEKFRARLVIERGESAGKEFVINGDETNIGRWDADGGIFPDVDLDAHDPEAKVSRRHARIVWQNGQFSVEDLGSTNGTFINRGRRLLPGDKQPLESGDEIIVGKTFLRFHIG